jgi:hypothetical protein
MPTNVQYLLSIKWDDSVHRPNVVVQHRLTLPPGMDPEDFESFARDNTLPELKKISTRAGSVARVALFRTTTNVPERFTQLDGALPEGVEKEIEPFRLVAEL